MVCPACGASNPETVTVCTQCGRGVTEADDSQTFILENPTQAPAAAAAGAMTWGTIHSQPGAAGASQFAPGSNFGRYRIEALLGEGGMGAVYRALDTELNRMVALKLVRPELATSPQTMQRFKQELLLASKISHKNVLRIHDLGDWNGVKFISMALVEGQDLAHLLEHSGRLPLERGLRFARQLCAALEAAHAEGVVHRDLKPQNILIDGTDNVYISDFGLAKSLEAEISMGTRTGQILGTPRYMSPEQVEAKEVDARSDLYSLGLIFYEMFTGELPFRGDSAMQLMYQRVTERARSPRQANPELPEYLANLILKLLEKDPEKRYQSAGEVLADLDAQRAPARVGMDTIRIQIPKPTRRGTAVALAITVVVAGALAAIPATRHAIGGLLPGAAKSGQAEIRFRMAVLPLKLVGDDAGLQYVADGVVDSLRAKLAGLRNVYTPASVSAKLAAQPDREMANQLGVNILVRGNLQSAGDQIRVTLRADDVRSGRNLLTREFAGVRQDLLRLEDQIFNQLADTLIIQQTSEETARNAMRPTQNLDAYDLYLRGESKINGKPDLKEYQAGLKMFEDAANLDPAFPLAYAGIADASLRIGRATKDQKAFERAQQAAEQAERLNPNLPEVHASLGAIYGVLGRIPEAISELKRALALAPNSDMVLRRLGSAYEKAKQRDKAIAVYQDAIRVNPYLGTNYDYLGLLYLDIGENQRAIENEEKATQLDPGNSDYWSNLGASYYQAERVDDAIAAFQKAIQLVPKPNYYSRLGVPYFFQGKYREAAQAFETAVANGANSSEAYVNLADSYRWMNEPKKATAAYDRAIELALKDLKRNPKDTDALGRLATAYAKKGQFASARQFIRQARQVDAESNDLMYREATVYTLAGQIPEALESLQAALSNGYSVLEARTDPELRRLRETPQFATLLKQFTGNRPK
jgi:eukaryotic-like serine/threonine-protein kinase